MDNRLCKKIYKIRNKTTGQFSTGGFNPKFTTNGKIWTQKSHLILHIKHFSKYEISKIYKNCEIVCYTMKVANVVEMTQLKGWIK